MLLLLQGEPDATSNLQVISKLIEPSSEWLGTRETGLGEVHLASAFRSLR